MPEIGGTAEPPRGEVTFRELLEEAVRTVGSQAEVADAIGIDRSRFNKVYLGKAEYGTFDLANCLRLARAIGRSPSLVLRAAGKAEEAALIEEMYGTERNIVLTPHEQKIFDLLRRRIGSMEPRDTRGAAFKTSLDGADEALGVVHEIFGELLNSVREMVRAARSAQRQKSVDYHVERLRNRRERMAEQIAKERERRPDSKGLQRQELALRQLDEEIALFEHLSTQNLPVDLPDMEEVKRLYDRFELERIASWWPEEQQGFAESGRDDEERAHNRRQLARALEFARHRDTIDRRIELARILRDRALEKVNRAKEAFVVLRETEPESSRVPQQNRLVGMLQADVTKLDSDLTELIASHDSVESPPTLTLERLTSAVNRSDEWARLEGIAAEQAWNSRNQMFGGENSRSIERELERLDGKERDYFITQIADPQVRDFVVLVSERLDGKSLPSWLNPGKAKEPKKAK